jgi:threonine aldolase
MREAMAAAQVGDDFYRDDPTVTEFEATAAGVLGKEAGIFVPSGTMGNLLAHLTHCPGGAEVIGPEGAHSFVNETGGPSRVAGMTVRSVPQRQGELDLDRIEALIRTGGVLSQATGLLWVEAPARGFLVPIESLRGLHALADKYGLPVHMDGARIFNQAVALDMPAADIAAFADSVMFCVSKGLAAPVGSVLVGPSAFIERARVWRQMLGGGMRQAGIIAAGGLFALQNNISRLADDHMNARRLATGLAALPGLRLDRDVVETNIFLVESSEPNLPIGTFAEALKAAGVLVNIPSRGRRGVRFVTHYGIEPEHIDEVLAIAGDIVTSLPLAGTTIQSGAMSIERR